MQGRFRSMLGFWLRLACFSMLTLVSIGYAVYVLTPKYDYGICSMVNFYQQPENSVDVLVVGTSMCYSGINTNVLWTEYGIPAYNLCSAEQPFWVSYYTIREALKTQQPRLILLDAQPARYPDSYSKPSRTILSTYGIRGIENRVGAILSCLESSKEAFSFIVGLPQVHAAYKDVTAEDFAYPTNNGGRGDTWKGYIEMDDIQRHSRPSLVWDDTCAPLNPREEAYARKIFELCRAEGVEIMLVGMPIPDYDNDHQFYNSLWAIAAEYGVTGINYNLPTMRFGLKYSTDFADWQHLNVNGSMVFSRKLGKDLKELFDLPDRRGDEAYVSYDTCAEIWYEKYPTFESSYWNEN